jgi:hypothetical protein
MPKAYYLTRTNRYMHLEQHAKNLESIGLTRRQKNEPTQEYVTRWYNKNKYPSLQLEAYYLYQALRGKSPKLGLKTKTSKALIQLPVTQLVAVVRKAYKLGLLTQVPLYKLDAAFVHAANACHLLDFIRYMGNEEFNNMAFCDLQATYREAWIKENGFMTEMTRFSHRVYGGTPSTASTIRELRAYLIHFVKPRNTRDRNINAREKNTKRDLAVEMQAHFTLHHLTRQAARSLVLKMRKGCLADRKISISFTEDTQHSRSEIHADDPYQDKVTHKRTKGSSKKRLWLSASGATHALEALPI